MAEPIAIGQLAAGLDLGNHEHISLVGGGGKTTAMFALGHQLKGHVVLTTTTKMGRDRTGGYPVLFSPTDEELRSALDEHGSLLAWGADANYKALGVFPETCDEWFGLADHVLVEADGSRQHPFKAPQPFEPVIPDSTTMVLACVGADALGRVIADQCHRPMRVAAIAGCSPYQRLTPERAATVLLSRRGSQKDRPDKARFAVVVNRVDAAATPFVDELCELLADRAPLVAVAPFRPGESPEHSA
ncbi:MAG: selenium cofactor biosynthesis protein YqeC [Acidimicrobiales bacterium]